MFTDMPATLLAILLFTTSFPSASLTSWMRPEAFHLRIGMDRGEAVRALAAWHPKPGKDKNEIVVDYTGEKALTLDFRDDRLHSIRFELFAFLPEVRKAFTEEKSRLQEQRGKPRKSTKAVLIYDEALPNVMVVLADDPKTKQGLQGIGLLAVRYYDPAATSIPRSPAPTAPATPPASQ
jgi:hypothetical protein